MSALRRRKVFELEERNPATDAEIVLLKERQQIREAMSPEAQVDKDFSSGGGAPFPSSIPSASAASTRTLGSLSPASPNFLLAKTVGR